MSNRIPEVLIDQVRQENDIVKVISDHVILKKAGKNFQGLCPFHRERKPSFMVSPDKQIFHCFGCGAGGNVFNFIMSHEKVAFPEAVRFLAQRVGIPIPIFGPTDEGLKEAKERDGLYELNKMAADYYHRLLLNTPKALDYLRGRQINPQTIDKFSLGYASSSWNNLTQYLVKSGAAMKLAQKGGLISARQGGIGHYDYFRDRIIFPIFDIQNRIIGFGGRALPARHRPEPKAMAGPVDMKIINGAGGDDSLPKYLNSPQTPIYNKSGSLYGLNLAKDSIRSKNCVIVVEGYTDVLMAHQEGITNAVASLGTSLTHGQIRLLKRYTEKSLLIYDADEAGSSATLRGFDLFIEQGMRAGVVSLPAGSDPDDFIRKKGRGDFLALLDDSQDLVDYRYNLARKRFDISTIDGKVGVVNDLLPSLAKIEDLIRQRDWIKRLAHGLSLDEAILVTELKRVKREGKISMGDMRLVEAKPIPERAEHDLLCLMLEESKVALQVQEELMAEDFTDPNCRRIVEAIFDLQSRSHKITPSKVMDHLKVPGLSQVISQLLMKRMEYPHKDKATRELINKIKDRKLRERYEELQKDIEGLLEEGKPVDPQKSGQYNKLTLYFKGSGERHVH
jgi:DNA primase